MSKPVHLNEDIFERVVSHLKNKANSLHEIRRFKYGGIEGWFKVEVVSALSTQVEKICNTGPDLLLADGRKLELKAGCGFDASHIRKGATKYNVPCIFLGYGGNLNLLNNDKVELIDYSFISDGYDDWTVGIIYPKQKN